MCNVRKKNYEKQNVYKVSQKSKKFCSSKGFLNFRDTGAWVSCTTPLLSDR